ncbi:MAG: hypothetical protein ABI673_11370 [Novosphingobium sp.]
MPDRLVCLRRFRPAATLLDRAVVASVLATTAMSLTALAIELQAVPQLATSSVTLTTQA